MAENVPGRSPPLPAILAVTYSSACSMMASGLRLRKTRAYSSVWSGPGMIDTSRMCSVSASRSKSSQGRNRRGAALRLPWTTG